MEDAGWMAEFEALLNKAAAESARRRHEARRPLLEEARRILERFGQQDAEGEMHDGQRLKQITLALEDDPDTMIVRLTDRLQAIAAEMIRHANTLPF